MAGTFEVNTDTCTLFSRANPPVERTDEVVATEDDQVAQDAFVSFSMDNACPGARPCAGLWHNVVLQLG